MTVFARSDVRSIRSPFTGQVFERKVAKKASKTAEAEYEPTFAIDADPETEQWLLETFPDQYARRADKVPPTPDEQVEHERLKEEGNILTAQMARAMADAAAKAVVAANQAA